MKGSADLATRFVLRADRLLSIRGQLGLVATKTIIQGAPLHVGMEQVTKSHLTIRAARPPHPWPTKSASLPIVEFWATRIKPSKLAVYWVDGEEVPAIGPDLEPYGNIRGRPMQLRENDGVAFVGSYILGPGFMLSEDAKDDLIAHADKNAKVLQPYVNGMDLSRRPDCSGSQWVINFRGWSLERAEEYPDSLDIVRRLVKPLRDKNKRKPRRERWWIYAERAPQLYDTIEHLDQVLAIAQTSSTVMPVLVSGNQVFDQTCIVFTRNDFASMAVRVRLFERYIIAPI